MMEEDGNGNEKSGMGDNGGKEMRAKRANGD